MALRKFVEQNFSLVLLLGAVLGLFIPSFDEKADEIVIILTAILIFLSCADIEKSKALQVDIFQVAVFTLVRFLVVPISLYYFSKPFFPEFSIGILLLCLMPAGVAVASLCSMSKGNVVVGLAITIISSLLAPFIVPSVFLFLGHTINVDIFNLFITLAFVVFLPILFYFGVVDRFEAPKSVVQKYNKMTAIIFLAIILTIVIAAQKEELIDNIVLIVEGSIVMTGLFLILYAFGFFYAKFFAPKDQDISYIYSSGAMNNSLAVGLAFAYFDAITSLFMVLSEIVWSFFVAVAQYIFSRRKN
ncbi:MAG: hypothetical protein AAF549_08630 [Pseudomonadota bacterium]